MNHQPDLTRSATKAVARPSPLLVPLLLAFITMAGCGESPPPSTPSQIASDGAFPMFATDSHTGTIYLAWIHTELHDDSANQDASRSIVMARSTDAGRTFSKPVRISADDTNLSAHSGAPPVVTVGPEGHVYVVYEQNMQHPGRRWGRSTLRVVRSEDQGQSFSKPVDVLQNEEATTSSGFHDAYVSSDGVLYVAWLDARQSFQSLEHATIEVRLSQSHDGGRTFAPSQRVHEVSCQCCRVNLAGGNDRRLYLAWRGILPQAEENQPPHRDIMIARLNDARDAWEKPERVHADQWALQACPHTGPDITVDTHGQVHAIWYTGKTSAPGVYYATSADHGQTFSDPMALLTDEWVPRSDIVRLLVDNSNGIWAAWEDRRHEPEQIRLTPIHTTEGVPDIELETNVLLGRSPDIAATDTSIVIAWQHADGGIYVHSLPNKNRKSQQ